MGMVGKDGKIEIYTNNSSYKLKQKRSQITKSKRFLEVSKILKVSRPLPIMFLIEFKNKEAIA